MLFRALVDFDLDLGVVLGSIWIVYEAVGERVIQNECERCVALCQHFDLINKGAEECAVRAVACERISLSQLINYFLKHALDSRVETAQGTWLESQLNLGDRDHARVTLKDVPVHILRFLHMECNL